MAPAAELPSAGPDPAVKQLASCKVDVEVIMTACHVSPYRPFRVEDFMGCAGDTIHQLRAENTSSD